MADLLLTTINARYIHASVGLRYLMANLGDLSSRAAILEFEVSQTAREIAEAILLGRPRLVGFGVYIWNTVRTREVVSIIRKVAPEVLIVIGGPEVSYEYEEQPLFKLCDYLVTGEADRAFADLCQRVFAGERPEEKVIVGGLPKLDAVELPYRLYTDQDLAHRVIYVEASRGCPFTCEFCLSSIDIPVRQFDHQRVLAELDLLFQRGARAFKFVDRTFNLNIRSSRDILSFFLDRMESGLFVHFEMVPDRFPEALREVVKRFPPGSLQLEIGVQTFNPEVSANISRRQDLAKLRENLRFLRAETTAHLHVDLIVGLPGEDIESFGQGFDQLVALDPQEIQVGILKRLRGTPICRHDAEFAMQYSEDPPYEILSTSKLSYLEIQRLSRFARYWDLVANSGNFASSRALIWSGAESPFWAFLAFSDWLFGRVGRRASISLKSLAELLYVFLTEERGQDGHEAGVIIARDYQLGGRADLPKVLQPFAVAPREPQTGTRLSLKRQAKFVKSGEIELARQS